MGPKSAMEPMVGGFCCDHDVPQRPTALERLSVSWLVAALPCYQRVISPYSPMCHWMVGWASGYWPVANLRGMESEIPGCKGSQGFAYNLAVRLLLIAVLQESSQDGNFLSLWSPLQLESCLSAKTKGIVH